MELLRHWDAAKVMPFNLGRKPRWHPAGHNATDYSRWAKATAPCEIAYADISYEPWGILHRCGTGLSDLLLAQD
jgi:hypothetical protein